MIRVFLDRLYLLSGYLAGLFLIAIFVLMMLLSGGRPFGLNIPAGDDFISWCMAATAFLGLALEPQKSTFERGDFLARGIVGFEKDTNAVAVADAGIRSGMSVQFLVRDADTAGEDLTHLVRDRVGPIQDPGGAGALVFCCNGRGTRMFKQPDHDISCLRAGLENEIPAGQLKDSYNFILQPAPQK